jgi:hypothetical protein
MFSEADNSSSRTGFFPQRNLDMPIIDTSLVVCSAGLVFVKSNGIEKLTHSSLLDLPEAYLSVVSTSCRRRVIDALKGALSRVRLSGSDMVTLEPRDYPHFLRLRMVDLSVASELIDSAERAVLPIVTAVETSIATRAGLAPPPTMRTLAPTAATEFLSNELIWSDIIERVYSLRASGRPEPIEITSYIGTVIVHNGLVFMMNEIGRLPRTVATWEQVLMLRDCSLARRNALVAASLLYPGTTGLIRAILASFRWQEGCIGLYGNAGYEIAKSTESLSKAYLSEITDPILAGAMAPWKLMFAKAVVKEDSVRAELGFVDPPEIYRAELYRSEVLSLVDHPAFVAELFGCQKFCGHPLINVLESTRKATRLAQSPDSTDPEAALLHTCRFKDMFTRCFIRKHARWPGVQFVGPRTALRAHHESGALVMPRGTYRISDWRYVNFRKEFDYDYFEDYLELMDDKSLSFERQDASVPWDKRSARTERRLLAELLGRTSFSVHEITQRVESGTIPRDWYIVSLYPKEKEFKREARMFSMMCIEMRTFFAAHEANLSQTILPFFPSITMTDNKTEVHERFLNITRPSNDDTKLKLHFELDLSSWNLLFRPLVVNGIGRQLNRLFGVSNVFTFGHSFFYRSMIVTRTSELVPPGIRNVVPPESPLLHYRHRGGFEGILQKLWSICTVVTVEEALAELAVSYQVTEQGDNVVLSVTANRDLGVSISTQAETLAKEVLRRSATAFAKINQELKPEECLVSASVITYSKVVYCGGVDLPLSCKALSRVTPITASDFPSYGSEIGAFFSTAVAAAETSQRPIRCYYMALFSAALHIYRSSFEGGAYRSVLRYADCLRTRKSVILQLIWPSELGGFPIVGPYSFIYRGGGDPTSKSLAGLLLMQDDLQEARQIVGFASTDSLFDPKPSVRSLLMDPYGLPIRKPVSPSTATTRETLGVVRGFCRNTDILSVLEYASGDYEDKLVALLSSMLPFNPVIARDIWDASVLGSLDAITTMFLKTRTIQNIGRRGGDSEIVDRLLTAGENEIRWMSDLLRSSDGHEAKIGSLYYFVEEMRTRWGSAGVLVESVTSYQPIDFAVHWGPITEEPGIIGELAVGKHDVMYTRGTQKPYLGSKTAEKRSEHGYKILGKDRGSKSLRTLQRILSWSDHGETFVQLIDSLSELRGGVRLSEYRGLLDGIIGGSSGHRYQARIAEGSAGPVGASTARTHMTFNSDHAGFLSASTVDYPVMFQEFFSELSSLLVFRWDHHRSGQDCHGTILIGSSSLESLPVDTLTLLRKDTLPVLARGLRLVQTDRAEIVRVSGPNRGSSYELKKARRKSLTLAALVSELRRATGSAGLLFTDLHASSKPVVTRIGILEAKGSTIDRIITACGLLIGETVLETTFTTIARTNRDSHSNDLVRRLAWALAQPIAQLAEHPTLSTDSFVVRTGSGPRPSYATTLDTRRNINSEILFRFARFFANPRSPLYTSDSVVFGSDPEGETYRSACRALRKAAWSAYLRLEISSEDADFIIGSTLARVERHHPVNESARLDLFRDICQTYDQHRRGRELVSFAASDAATRIGLNVGFNSVRWTNASVAEVLRLTRGRRTRPTRARKLLLESEDSSPLFEAHLVAYRGPPVIVSTVSATEYSTVLKLGVAEDLGSSAVRVFSLIARVFKGQRVLVVGSGLGGCAVAAVIGGCIEVRCHDLKEDLPRGSDRLSYLPPLVRFRGLLSDRLHSCRTIKQTTESWSTSGDWTDPNVSSRVLETISADWLVVVDIPAFRHDVRPVLLPLTGSRHRYEVIFRLRGDSSQLASSLGYLHSSGKVETIVGVRELREVVELLVLWTSSLGGLPRRVSHMVPSIITTSVPKNGKSSLRLLTLALISHIGASCGRTVELTLIDAITSFRNERSGALLRASYANWTWSIAAAVSCAVLLDTHSTEYVARVRLFVESPTVTLERLGPDSYIVTREMLYLLSNVASCLVGNLEKRI